MPRSSGSNQSATAAQSTAAVAVTPTGMLQQVARTHAKRAATQFPLRKRTGSFNTLATNAPKVLFR
jgi:hypothetical protein